MGKILNTKSLPDGQVLFEVVVDYDEALKLQGHVTNIRMFSENTFDNKIQVSMRGSMASTKYFLIPKKLRHSLRFGSDIKCQKIETPSKVIFVYVMDNPGEE